MMCTKFTPSTLAVYSTAVPLVIRASVPGTGRAAARSARSAPSPGRSLRTSRRPSGAAPAPTARRSGCSPAPRGLRGGWMGRRVRVMCVLCACGVHAVRMHMQCTVHAPYSQTPTHTHACAT
eukprot:scaffold22334_cov71-Phaeocystis_antarctica.AAC.2